MKLDSYYILNSDFNSSIVGNDFINLNVEVKELNSLSYVRNITSNFNNRYKIISTPFLSIYFFAFYFICRRNKLSGFISSTNGNDIIYVKSIVDSQTISHEHIHLLQKSKIDRYDFYENQNIDIKDIVSASSSNRNINPRLLSYYLIQDEFEARLHEVIISIVKNNGDLYFDYKDVIEFISLDLIEGHVKSAHDTTNSELRLVINTFIENDLTYELCHHFIPFSYANLISYYGFNKEADQIIIEIKSNTEKS